MSKSTILVPNAAAAMNKFKFEVASQIGVSLKPDYNGDITCHNAGKIGGNMVKKLIAQAESTIR